MNNKTIENLKNIMNEKCVVLENGLTVLVCEMPDYNSIYAAYGTDYGSVVRNFKLGDKVYNLPAGVAHFLEHKMFENEEGVDAFSLYAKTGASANAFTSFDKTCYIFGATDKLDESLDILLSFVSKPFFTKATVLKEQGIIGQEIKMYDDNPEWRMMFALLNGLYSVCPLKDDIAGTVESIAEITPELLYACTDAFYRPSNMVLSVAGNITLERVLAACDRANIKTNTEKVEILPFCEPMEINKKFAEVKMSVSQPILGLAYKEKPVEKKDRLKVGIISDILSQLLVGDTSDFYEEYYNKGLINPGFGCEYLMGDGYFTVYFSGESKEPETVLNAIRNEILKMKTEGINKERFEAVKNTLLGDAITGTEKTEDIALDMLDMHFMGENRFENVNILVNLTVDDVQKVLANSFDEDMSCVVNILPN